jgi:hypothetical protein
MTSFASFWQTDLTRDALLDMLDKPDLANLRLVCRAFSPPVARFLFRETEISFQSSTFTKPSRMAALERVGANIKTLAFRLSHNAETFLPPLVDPETGEEQVFVYTPQHHHQQQHNHSHRASSPTNEAKYGSWEMTDLLVKQYPPLFHAATNVPSFVRAFNCMTGLRHLKIVCDGQPAHRYRRSVVDYALISLRIAVEQAPQLSDRLESLSLLPIHPAGIMHLRPTVMGMGVSPNGRKRWARIRKLAIQMESFPYEGDESTTDQLKILHSYLQSFSNVHSFAFRWTGEQKGPCPLSLVTEPAVCQPSVSQNACPKTYARNGLRALKFAHLRYLELENVLLDAFQASDFIAEHKDTLDEFYFEHVALRSGTWDDAFAPLRKEQEDGKLKKEGGKEKQQTESMEVPFMLDPLDRTTSSSSSSSKQRQKKKKTKKRKRKANQPDINSSLFASTAALLWEDQEQSNPKLRALREGVSQLARSRARTDHMKKTLWSSMFCWR